MTTAIATNRPRHRSSRIEPLAFSIPQVSQATSLSERAIQRLIAAEELGSIHVGRRVLIPRVALENFLTVRTDG